MNQPNSHRDVVCCLWAGHDLPGYSANQYTELDVWNLWRGVHQHVTNGRLTVLADETWYERLTAPKAAETSKHLTDEEVVAIEHTLNVRPMKGHGTKHRGWTHVFEAFDPDLRKALDVRAGQRLVAVGLDTIFVRNSDWLWEWEMSPVGLPADPYSLNGAPCDAVITMNLEGSRQIWDEWVRSEAADPGSFPHMYAGKPSEMALLQACYARLGWTKLEGDTMDKLASYKALVKPYGLPDHTTVVYFHGKPKPRDLRATDPIGKLVMR